MKITAKNRVILGYILPTQDTFANQLIAEGIREKIKFPETLLEKINICLKQDIPWNLFNENYDSVDIELTDVEKNLLKDRIKLLDDEKKVLSSMIEMFTEIKSL